MMSKAREYRRLQKMRTYFYVNVRERKYVSIFNRAMINWQTASFIIRKVRKERATGFYILRFVARVRERFLDSRRN